MANKLVETTLNDLLNGELRAHHAYLQAAAWAAERNLDGCYKFLLGHAAEELEHMHRIFSFLNDLGGSSYFHRAACPTGHRKRYQGVVCNCRATRIACHRRHQRGG
nr:ferritin-like domain-containing protein [Rhizobium sp. 28DA2]